MEMVTRCQVAAWARFWANLSKRRNEGGEGPTWWLVFCEADHHPQRHLWRTDVPPH